MNFIMDQTLAKNYKSNSQKARVITETWVAENFKCPYCKKKLKQYNPNNECADYYCSKCNEDFELKTKNGKFSNLINGASYKATLNKISSNRNSNWILLEHKNFTVTNLTFIPKCFFYDSIVEAREPLKQTARRAGWQGCRLNMNMIPSFGKIKYIKDSQEIDKKIIAYHLKMANPFKNANLKDKSWKLEVLSLVDSLPENIFTLKELEKLIPTVQDKHPNNKHIDAKFRQVLQILRNEGYVLFLGDGLYQKLF